MWVRAMFKEPCALLYFYRLTPQVPQFPSSLVRMTLHRPLLLGYSSSFKEEPYQKCLRLVRMAWVDIIHDGAVQTRTRNASL